MIRRSAEISTGARTWLITGRPARVGSGSRAIGRSKKAVHAGVGRHEDEVMREHEPEVPQKQLFHVATAEDPVERERDDREADQVSQKV